MRWIFYVLLGANTLLLGWHLLTPNERDTPRPSGAPASATPLPQGAQSIVLLRESSISPVEKPSSAAKSERTDRTDQSSEETLEREPPSVQAAQSSNSSSLAGAPQSGAPPSGSLTRALCTFVGPYDTAELAEQLVERLAAMDVSGQVADVEIPAGPGYWVYLQPLESRREALRRLTELQAQGVDSYIVPRGELMNAISLGMFSQEPLAHARVAEMADMGLDAKIDVIERSYKEIWVSIPEASAAKLNDQAWQRLLESNKTADRRQNFCLHVASQDNIH